MLSSLYVLEGLPGWAPPLRSKKHVRTKPKYYFADPSIPASLLRASPQSLLRDTQTLGNLFETLVLRDVRTFVSAMPGAANRIGFYRDDKGLEADIIIELGDGRWGAIEVKLSEAKADDEAASRLLRLARKLTANPAEQTKSPEFLAIVVGKSFRAYRRNDGVLVIPMVALEP